MFRLTVCVTTQTDHKQLPPHLHPCPNLAGVAMIQPLSLEEMDYKQVVFLLVQLSIFQTF